MPCATLKTGTRASGVNRQEAEAAEAQRKREGVIKTLLTDAEKRAAEAKTEPAPAKETAASK